MLGLGRISLPGPILILISVCDNPIVPLTLSILFRVLLLQKHLTHYGLVLLLQKHSPRGSFRRRQLHLPPLITGASVLVLQMEIPRTVTEYAFRMAKAAGVYVVFNAAPALEVDCSVLTGADCLIVNETEAAGYLQVKDIASPQAAAAAGLEFVKAGGNTLIITLGSQGSVLVRGRETRHFPVDLGLGAVETTGCGDSYVGAFAYQKAMGADDETACAFASAASQLIATGVGAQPAMPDLAAVRRALASSRH